MKKAVGMRISVTVVVLMHCVAFASLFLMQGCGSTKIEREASLQPSVVMPPVATPDRTERLTPMRPPVVSQPAVSAKPWIKDTKTYVVNRGDTMSGIAKRFGVDMPEILRLNGLSNPNRIRVGQKLVVPAYAKVSPPPAGSVTPDVKPATAGGEYTVVAGDTLSGIAQRHGIKTAELKRHNRLSSDMIRIGQKLRVPGTTAGEVIAVKPPVINPPADVTPQRPAPDAGGSSDEVPTIPRPSQPDLAVDLEEATLPDLEPDSADDELLDVTGGAAGGADIHVVKEGEDLYSIAKKWGVFAHDIVTANNLTDAELKPGQELKIP